MTPASTASRNEITYRQCFSQKLLSGFFRELHPTSIRVYKIKRPFSGLYRIGFFSWICLEYRNADLNEFGISFLSERRDRKRGRYSGNR